MKVLVTGGAGFIGSHLCRKLIQEGKEVICMDNFFTGSKNNVLDLINNPAFELFRGDVTEKRIIEVDEVYHLACPASPIHYQRNPAQTVRTGVLGTLNMLELCRETKAKFLITSTSEVYGDPEIHPQPEEYNGNVNCIGVRSNYDEGKRCAETLCICFNKQYNVDAKISRLFNCYGPSLHFDDGRVVSNFILQALRNEPITIYGKGEQTRSFCYVSDTIKALIKLMEINYNLPVNIGNPEEFTIMELAEMVIGLTKSNSKIIYLPLPQDDPTRRKPDITKAKTLLSWEPSVPLKDGLELTIQDFKKRLV